MATGRHPAERLEVARAVLAFDLGVGRDEGVAADVGEGVAELRQKEQPEHRGRVRGVPKQPEADKAEHPQRAGRRANCGVPRLQSE